jgi:lysozyme
MTPDRIKILGMEEGFRSMPYRDSRGVLSIGFGTAIGLGISSAQAAALRDVVIDENETMLVKYPWFVALDSVRKDVIEDMCYNIGMSKLLGFKEMIQGLIVRDFDKAATEMLNSDWHAEVPHRVGPLAEQMRTGNVSA